jgi:hypothetical protein
MGLDHAGVSGPPGSGARFNAPAGRVARRELQRRQASGPAFRQRLHRCGLSQRAAGTGERSRGGLARELPARALHQQPRECVGACHVSCWRARRRQGRPQAAAAAGGGAHGRKTGGAQAPGGHSGGAIRRNRRTGSQACSRGADAARSPSRCAATTSCPAPRRTGAATGTGGSARAAEAAVGHLRLAQALLAQLGRSSQVFFASLPSTFSPSDSSSWPLSASGSKKASAAVLASAASSSASVRWRVMSSPRASRSASSALRAT